MAEEKTLKELMEKHGVSTIEEALSAEEVGVLCEVRQMCPSLQGQKGWNELSQTSDLDEISLSGVRASGGRVAELALVNCGLTGELLVVRCYTLMPPTSCTARGVPPSVAKLAALTALDVSQNRLDAAGAQMVAKVLAKRCVDSPHPRPCHRRHPRHLDNRR